MAKGNAVINMSLESSLSDFSGNKDEDIRFFIDKISRISELEKWPEARKTLVLQMHLKGNALKFLMQDQTAKNEQQFDNLCRLLTTKFQKTISFNEAQNTFQNLIQVQNESVKQLAENIDNYGTLYMNPNNSDNPEIRQITEKIKLNKFLDALRQDIQLEVRKSAPKTFIEAIQTAKNVEAAMNSMGSLSHNLDLNVNALFQQQVETNKQILTLQSQILDLSKPSVVNAMSSQYATNFRENEKFEEKLKDKIECHICGKPHLTTVCWYFPSQQQNNYRKNFNDRGNHYRRTRFRGNKNNKNSRFVPYKNRRQDLN